MRPYRIGQVIATILFNAYVLTFFERTLIYTGYLKGFLVPILNCWSTPTALFSCPLGAYQHFIIVKEFPFYVLGFFLIIGAFIGRMPCGWVCPFGMLQDLLYKIKVSKIRLPNISPLFTITFFIFSYLLVWLRLGMLPLSFRLLTIGGLTMIGLLLDVKLRIRIRGFDLTSLKYFFLIFIATFIVFYTQEPWFCKLCPAGTLEAGIPLLLYDPQKNLRAMVGLFFYIKIAILTFTIIASLPIKRPFCRLGCPIGAIYSFLNKVSLFHLTWDKKSCTECEVCDKFCPTNIKVYENPNQLDCIRCLECYYRCPRKSVRLKIG